MFEKEEQSFHNSNGTLSFSLKYLFTNKENKYQPLVVTTLLFLASFLFVPLFTLLGYGLKVLESAARGRDEVPLYEDYVELTIRGLFFFGAGFLYFFVLLFGVLIVGVLAQIIEIAIFLAFPIVLAWMYLYPAFIMRYAIEKNSFQVLFEAEELVQLGFSYEYIMGMLVAILLQFIILVTLVISIITLVGPIIIQAVSYPIMFSLYGYIYYKYGI